MSNFKYQPIKSDSGNILEAAHDGTSTCRVRFKNGLYENTVPVPTADYEKFSATFQDEASSGSHFHSNMKKFGFKKIG